MEKDEIFKLNKILNNIFACANAKYKKNGLQRYGTRPSLSSSPVTSAYPEVQR